MYNKEKIAFFHELICTNYDMFLWNYRSDLSLIDTTSVDNDIIADVGFTEKIQNHIALGQSAPLILETQIGLVWIAGFAFENHRIESVHLIGPSFIGRDTPTNLLKKLNGYNLSVHSRSIVTKMIAKTPVIPSSTLFQYAIMLHYTLNNEKILVSDVIYATSDNENIINTMDEIPDEHNGIWINEQKLCKMFEDGNPDYKKALSISSSISSGVKADIGDSVRKHKNNAIVLLTLCSRSCMKGGMDPSFAYNLNDYYIKRFEECKLFSDVAKLCDAMVDDYMSHMKQIKESADVSSQIQSSCYYIKQHIHNDISIRELADRYGYTEYYFSHKFKKEMGCNVNLYILNEKLNQSKLLLSGTTQSIQEISDSLAFCNRSYFYSCFRRQTGISPNEYRKKNAQL
ncbi:MAG: AraC family transcriptional regulator [Butyrivibrio sp.]|jgi:AraC-like DNA-binding protein|nr:AraC family transcriptional regulator [Butyrivibrio sp.]